METKQKISKKKSAFKKVLHPNRYFIWAIVVIVLGLGSLTAYIYISGVNDSSSQMFAVLTQRNSYSNASLGFSVNYPNGWVIDAGSQTSTVVSFDNPNNPNEAISISSASLASVAQFKKTSKIESVNNFKRDSLQIAVYEISSPEGAKPLRVSIIQSAKKAYYISGDSASFMTFVNTFKAI